MSAENEPTAEELHAQFAAMVDPATPATMTPREVEIALVRQGDAQVSLMEGLLRHKQALTEHESGLRNHAQVLRHLVERLEAAEATIDSLTDTLKMVSEAVKTLDYFHSQGGDA